MPGTRQARAWHHFLLSRITEPTAGYAEIHGRVGSLPEVGTGFHPELTGRENIYLNGAILGMKRAEIERKFDEIVAFAEVERFIDTPVKRYSSGMYVHLALSWRLTRSIMLIKQKAISPLWSIWKARNGERKYEPNHFRHPR